MNEFLEECLREWRRLGVPGPIAREMAADLEADLEEARADGVTPEEVLGRGAFDPRSFAAAWASERGVSRPSRAGSRLSGASLLVAALAAFVAVTVSGVAIMALAPSARSRVEALPRRLDAGPVLVTPTVTADGLWVPAPNARLGPLLRRDPLDGDTSHAGLMLLVVGLSGTALLASLWLWSARGRGPHRPYVGHPPGGSAF